jgi:hypothetical protein
MKKSQDPPRARGKPNSVGRLEYHTPQFVDYGDLAAQTRTTQNHGSALDGGMTDKTG